LITGKSTFKRNPKSHIKAIKEEHEESLRENKE
jgi:hypothetical protein